MRTPKIKETTAQKWRRIGIWTLGITSLLIVTIALLVWLTTFHPTQIQPENVTCSENAPQLVAGQSLKILTYNIQYMAGKNYIFFYDLPNQSGPHERPNQADIAHTTSEVARIIEDEAPDIILLQEVDDGADRTDREDQLANLLALLPPDYRCHTSAFYWQAKFVPHPRIRGAVGHKLSIVSKYHIQSATRYQLPTAPNDILTQQFSYKRALLEVEVPFVDGTQLFILNTHLEVSNRGEAIKRQEVVAIQTHLDTLNQTNKLWIMGGDFNLLLPQQYHDLPVSHQPGFRAETELAPMLNTYAIFPHPETNKREPIFTMFPNDPVVTKPDRTTDYIFYADQLSAENSYVRHHDTLAISDHLPVVVTFKLP